ncbi:MAG: potassium-transporting ATPase subunit KdpC [Holophaga sp.]|nr:potassium-transporting ATPase subunit KdpC [Holophaga sp.]
MSMLRPALVTFAGLTVLAGIAYPLAVTGAANLCFPRRAQGSLLIQDGQVRGSALIAQHTEEPRYFWGRLSDTAGFQTNADASGGANLSAGNPALRAAAEKRVRALRAADPGNADPVPLDLVTASASGLDPHISPQAASYQAARVARARNLPKAKVLEEVAGCTEARQWGVFGESRVNVLKLNLALDSLH